MAIAVPIAVGGAAAAGAAFVGVVLVRRRRRRQRQPTQPPGQLEQLPKVNPFNPIFYFPSQQELDEEHAQRDDFNSQLASVEAAAGAAGQALAATGVGGQATGPSRSLSSERTKRGPGRLIRRFGFLQLRLRDSAPAAAHGASTNGAAAAVHAAWPAGAAVAGEEGMGALQEQAVTGTAMSGTAAAELAGGADRQAGDAGATILGMGARDGAGAGPHLSVEHFWDQLNPALWEIKAEGG